MVGLDAETRRVLLERLAEQVDPAFFETWCRSLDLVPAADGGFEVPCPSRFWRDMVEPRLRGPLAKALEQVTGSSARVAFTVDDKAPAGPMADPVAPPPPSPAAAPPRRSDPGFLGTSLREEYTFDALIEGPSNRFAIGAAIDVARRPFEHPLFVHGKSGVGKTHLLHALCHLVRREHPPMRTVYIPCEAFISDFLNSIKVNRTEEFRTRYKSADFLVIDDVDQLANKEATQSEFFHILNHLSLTRKQVVLSSDSSPRGILTLKERLFSRFESGLVVSIEPPELETRMAIVRAKGERKGKEIPQEVCRLIAELVTDNVRELEGAVVKVIALAHLTGGAIGLELAREALKEKLEPRPRMVTCEDVIAMVAAHYRVAPGDLRRHTRKEQVVAAKQVCLYLCHEALKHSTRELAAALGLASHNSVAVAVRRVRERAERNAGFRGVVERLRQEIERHRLNG